MWRSFRQTQSPQKIEKPIEKNITYPKVRLSTKVMF